MRYVCTELYIPWVKLSRRQLSPALATAHYCCPDNAIGLVDQCELSKNGKGSPYSTAERRVPELIPVLGSQPAGDVSHKPGGRLPLLSARPAVTVAILKRAATSFAAW